jgi:Zn-dependent M28 family amino/carboxypeptidase
MSKVRHLLLICVPAILTACAGDAGRDAALATIDAAEYRTHVARLASDEFEGRKPGTRGERITIEYLESQFKRLGLTPGNGNDYTQRVPIVEITAATDASLRLGSRTLRYPEDAVIWTKRVETTAELRDSPLVFVGYGVVAPEYGWNDYAGLDMRGKTAVILVNDPGWNGDDPKLFNGRAMTYYGRWTYKFEEAARQGAAGALIIHETVPAAYGWESVQNSWTGPQLDMASADGNRGRVQVEGWITLPEAEHLLGAAGVTYAEAVQRASVRGFRGFELGTTASANLRNSVRKSDSQNVIGVIRGAKRPNEYVYYMAHWDHLGRTLGRSGDTIFNGAADNATGTAGLLAIAEAFQRSGRPPERSVVFLAVTAEEAGLLGSAYYVAEPIYPLAQTVAVLNMDNISFGGPTRDVSVVGMGASELEEYLARYAARQDRVLRAEPTPEKGFFYRSDHFNFAKAGVPALYFKLGIDDRANGAAWGQQQQDDFTANRYHKVSDEYRDDADLRGGVEDLELMYAIGRQLAREKSFPNWYPQNEFRAVRDRSRAIMK